MPQMLFTRTAPAPPDIFERQNNFFKDSLKILDIAPTQPFQEMCKNLSNIDYLSADISSPLAMLRMDITRISLTDNQFDYIICYHVLEHIPMTKKP